MTRCPICGKILEHSEVCDRCGYDERKDYEVLPTLGTLHRDILSVEEIRSRAKRGVEAYESKSYELAVEDLMFAAEHGDARAQVTLGKCYSEGNGVQFHEIEAVRWYQKAAEQSEPEAEYLLGEACSVGKLVPIDREKAMEWYQRAAEHGSVDAIRKLGFCYLNGIGVAGNPEEGSALLKKAAELGDGPAQEQLGCCYLDGRGIAADPKEAELWYRKAAETYRALAAKGDTAAEGRLAGCYLRGRGVPQNIKDAELRYQMAAQGGDSDAALALSVIYQLGVDKDGLYRNLFGLNDSKDSEDGGIAADDFLCKYWHEMSAKDFEGMVLRGDERMAGYFTLGTPHPEGAVKWYRKAAERGYAAAQVKLGQCYEEGLGVDKNRETAARWYEKAALRYQEMEELYIDISQASVRFSPTLYKSDAGKRCYMAAEAMFRWGNCCAGGIGRMADSEEALKWYQRSIKWCRMGAEWDDGDALYRLGWYYQNGIAVEQDREKAGELFERAVSKGNALARAAYDEWKRG